MNRSQVFDSYNTHSTGIKQHTWNHLQAFSSYYPLVTSIKWHTGNLSQAFSLYSPYSTGAGRHGACRSGVFPARADGRGGNGGTEGPARCVQDQAPKTRLNILRLL
ncbi:hypothetical protein PilKf_01581 [Pillotina sp. SPG140]